MRPRVSLDSSTQRLQHSECFIEAVVRPAECLEQLWSQEGGHQADEIACQIQTVHVLSKMKGSKNANFFFPFVDCVRMSVEMDLSYRTVSARSDALQYRRHPNVEVKQPGRRPLGLLHLILGVQGPL